MPIDTVVNTRDTLVESTHGSGITLQQPEIRDNHIPFLGNSDCELNWQRPFKACPYSTLQILIQSL
jgi:hypothetical protein